MKLNEQKYFIATFNQEDDIISTFLEFFPFIVTTLDEFLKHPGFRIKPNCYKKEDWSWLLEELDHGVNIWCNRWISREDNLIFVKSIIKSIPIYWMDLAWIPKSVMKDIEKIAQDFFGQGITIKNFFLG